MQATRVFLREKKINNGRLSLYLDFYPAIKHPETGKPTRREFLKLYLYEKPKTALEKQVNKETKALADQVRAQRQLDIQAENFGFLEMRKKHTSFLDYFQEMIEDREGSNKDNWLSAYRFLYDFTGGLCKFGDINELFCEKFLVYLKKEAQHKGKGKGLSDNTIYSYYGKFKAALKKAVADKLLPENPAQNIKVKQAETQREFLTLEELNLLAAVECDPPALKQAALFAALTGLRWSDVSSLTWGQLHHSETDGYSIRFRQQKTKGVETLPIPEQAVEQMGEPRQPNDLIFPNLVYSNALNYKLKKWVAMAGIQRNISFHCFRHTFATLQLTAGTDIYTVSKMLGHRELKTTQVYAKVIDKKKQETTTRIKLKLS